MEKLTLLRETEVLDYFAISRIELLKAASKLAKWQMTREHRAVWTEDFDGLKYPWADLTDRPIDSEEALHPENFDNNVGTSPHPSEVTSPTRVTFTREVNRPTHQGKNKLDIGVGRGYSCKIR